MFRKPNKPAFAMSRRVKNTLISIITLLVLFFVWLDCTTIGTYKTFYKPASQRYPNDIDKYHEKTFTVVNVVDGDTIDIEIPDGNYANTRIRLLGIDTPETKHPQFGECFYGPQAYSFTEDMILGKKVTVYLDEKRTRGYYGRLLAYIQLPDKRFLNEVLLSEGFAYADFRFRHDFYNKYRQLESIARSREKGLWKEVTFEQMPQWRQKEK